MESYRPASTITDYAHKHGFDLIVMATHGYTGMKGMMLGSVALKVLHESNVPVLLIRPEACQYKFVSPEVTGTRHQSKKTRRHTFP